jgi:multiple sugar transport system ATP-binding protein
MAEVRLEGVTKVYPDGTTAVSGLDLVLADGELLVLVGPSGCGKTTALRMVAGLEHITAGTIRIGGRVVNDLSESERDIAMVFQNYALYPHMSVRDNIAFPLKLARVRRPERDDRIARVAGILGLTPLLDQKPAQLSGGQRQRVAMGRAIVREPQLFLMDEPLSNLDAKLRVQMRADILELQRELGTTTMYVTHDQAEAMTLGDRVAVMHDGRLQQIGPPEVVYQGPDNVFVASFLGSPAMNLVRGQLAADVGGVPTVQFGTAQIPLDALELARHPGLQRRGASSVIVGIRPESFELAPPGHDERLVEGVIIVRESLGSDVYVRFRVPGIGALGSSLDHLGLDDSDTNQIEVPAEDPGVLVSRLPATSTVARNDPIALAIVPGALRLFDPTTGASLAESRLPGADSIQAQDVPRAEIEQFRKN